MMSPNIDEDELMRRALLHAHGPDRVFSPLLAHLGGDFLSGARTFVAFKKQDCLFRSSYKYNFLLDSM